MKKNKKVFLIVGVVLVISLVAILFFALLDKKQNGTNNNGGNNAGENGSGSNTGGNGTGSNTGGNGSGSNTEGNGSGSNTGGNGSGSNTEGNGSGSNTGGNGTGSNTGGNGTGSNTGGNGSGSNTGGNGTGGNTGGNDSNQVKTRIFSCKRTTKDNENGIEISDSLTLRYHMTKGLQSDELVVTIKPVTNVGKERFSALEKAYKNWFTKLNSITGITMTSTRLGERAIFNIKTDYTKLNTSSFSCDENNDNRLCPYNDIRPTDNLETVTRYLNVANYTCKISEV